MLWRPISRGSTVKVTQWLEEPSIFWGRHLEDFLPRCSVVELPVQIPSTGDILTQNWNITSKQYIKTLCEKETMSWLCLIGYKLSPGTFTVLNNPLILRQSRKLISVHLKHTQVAVEPSVKCLTFLRLLPNYYLWSYWRSLFVFSWYYLLHHLTCLHFRQRESQAQVLCVLFILISFSI